jgi:succinyl-diaminopimelate desuccinylase
VAEFGLLNATIHKPDEQVAVADLMIVTAIYERILASYLAGAPS